MPTDQDIYESVVSAITAIRRDVAELVTPDTALGQTLGLESLDYVDLEFRLETAFGVEFYHGSAVEKLAELLAPRRLEHDGLLTPFGAAVLHRRLPELDPARLAPGQPVAGIEAAFTPATWIRVVKELLEARPRRCPSCAADRLEVLKPSIARCESCSTEIRFPDGEDCLTAWAQALPSSLVTLEETSTR